MSSSLAATERPAAVGLVGSGEPVLLIHPFLLDRLVWTEVAQDLARDHTVLTVTLPGHRGGPDLPWTRDVVAPMLDHLESVLDAHGWTDCHVVGNSLGGWLAFELERRGRARSVTAIAPAGGWTSFSLPAVRLGLTFLPLEPTLLAARPFARLAVASRAIQHAAMSVIAADPSRVPAQVARRSMEAALGAGSILRTLWAAAWSNGVGDLSTITTPVHLVLCDDDRVIPWRTYARRFLDDLPATTRCTLLRGVGHVPMLEDPSLVARTVRTFVSDQARAS